MCTSQDSEPSAPSSGSRISGTLMPFLATLVLYQYIYTCRFFLPLSPLSFIFFSITVLIFSPMFHVSPWSLFSSVFFSLLRNSSLILLWKIVRSSVRDSLPYVPPFQMRAKKLGLGEIEKTWETCLAPEILYKSRISFWFLLRGWINIELQNLKVQRPLCWSFK